MAAEARSETGMRVWGVKKIIRIKHTKDSKWTTERIWCFSWWTHCRPQNCQSPAVQTPTPTYDPLPRETLRHHVCGYLTKTHKRKVQSLLNRGLRWACKDQYLTSNQTIRESPRACSLNATIRTLSRKFYRRCARFEGNPLIIALGRNTSVWAHNQTCLIDIPVHKKLGTRATGMSVVPHHPTSWRLNSKKAEWISTEQRGKPGRYRKSWTESFHLL